MPDDHEPPMTNLELRDAIQRTPPHTDDWHALTSEACKRATYGRDNTYPLSWLPTGVSWSHRTDYGSSGVRGTGI
jgi:hypothetical protein